MAINFPDTTGELTDGSFTYDHLNNTWVWNGISWSIQNIISTYTNSDVNTLLNKDASSDGKVLSWDQNSDSYTWVDQPTVGTQYADSDVDTHLNQDGNISDGYVLSWDVTADNNNGDYAWVAQSSGGTQYADSDVDTHLNKDASSDGKVLSWNQESGEYAWVDQPTVGTPYADSDVNTHLNVSPTNPTDGYVLSWDATADNNNGDYAWTPSVNQTLGVIPTSLPSNGHVLSWDTSLNGNQGGYAWVAQSSGGGSSVSISDLAPSSPSSGDLWWDSDNGNLKIYYTDTDSSQWVDTYTTEASSGGGGSSSSSSITDGTSTLSFDSNNSISIDTHIIPDTNAAYDLGNAEYKIRHLFLSDNSLWIGDGHKIDTSDGTFKTRKRKKNTVPSSVIEAYKTSTGNSSATLQEVAGQAITWLNSESYSVTELNEITLDMWIKYLNFLDSTKDNVEDLYPPEYINDSENINYKIEDYDEVIGQKQEGKLPASITQEEGGFYNLILFKSKRMVIIEPTGPISVNVIGAEPIDGNTVEFTVYIKQSSTEAQNITNLSIDNLPVTQLRISGGGSVVNQVNTYDIKLVCLGDEWFGTAVRG